MSASAILNTTQIAENQSNKYITHNDAIDALEQASNASLNNTTVSAGPVTITQAQATRNVAFRVSAKTANFSLTMPQFTDVGLTVAAKRLFVVRNEDTTYDCTVSAVTGGGATVAVKAGYSALILQVSGDMYAVMVGPTTTLPYDLGMFVPGKPDAGVTVMKFSATRAITIPGNMAGAQGHIAVAPTATLVLDVQKNGSSVGSISISTGSAFTFSTTASAAISLAVGDRLSIIAPSPQDATGSDINVNLAATRAI